MTDFGHPLIRTKLNPTAGTHPWIPPAQLDEGLARILAVPLTVVTAPAGFGKTTRLAQWRNAFRARDIACAWLTIDADDDDIHQFFSYLLEAMSEACAAGAERARELIRNDPLLSYRQVMSVLLSAIGSVEGHVVLLLDDVHLLESAAVNDALHRFVRYAPANLHVVAAGRTEPLIQVSRFQTQRQLYRLETDDLRFSVEDTRRFFAEVVGRALDPLEVAEVWRATEGWIAGIQLTSIADGAHRDQHRAAVDFEGAKQEISVYLTENVLASMPQRLVGFMLRISILDRVSGALAASVSGYPDAHCLLEQLEQRNLFLASLDERHEWYRFHALFLDYLRARAEREIAAELPGLHDRCSEYFAQSGWWQDAVKHALAAGEDRKAAGWVERCAMDLIHRSALRTVIGWLGRLPERVIAGSIRLRLAQAWACTLALQPRDAVNALAALEQDLSTGRLAEQADEELKREILSVRAITAGLTDDSTHSLRLARQVLDLAPEPGSWVERIAHTALVFGLAYERGFDEARELHRRIEARYGHGSDEPTYAGVYQQCMFGLSALIEGKLLDAEAAFSSALRRGEDSVGFESAAATLPAGYLSTLLYEWNELDRLDKLLHRRLTTALGVCANGSASRFMVSLVRLNAIQGKHEQAFLAIERASRVARERGWMRLLTSCQGEAIRLMLIEGDVVRANRTLDVLRRALPRRSPSPLGSYVEVRFNISMSMARLMLAKDLADDAQIVLAELSDDLAQLGCEYHLAHARILQATALERAGATGEALDVMGSALEFGQKWGMIRGFLDAGDEVRDLMLRLVSGGPNDCQARRLDRWYVENLIRLGGDAGPADTQGGPPAAAAYLRPREQEILWLLVDGQSNKAIARELSLSPETVKWHFKNIFRKLSVTSRVQAVRWAREHLSDRSD